MHVFHYNFIIPKSSGFSLDQLKTGETCDIVALYCLGEYCWALQSYHILKEHGLPVELSYDLDPSAINLAHRNILHGLERRWDCFCVSLQADFPQFPMAQYHIVQNREQASDNAEHIPSWPQPKLIGRDAARRSVVNVAYQGARQFTAIDEARLNADLKPHGLTFKVLGPSEWHDLSQVDILLGIRCFGKKKYRRKPPSKLINAWHARIPFIGGWDSAYLQVGVDEEDFLRVGSYADLLQCILRVRSDPSLYDRLVESGTKKAHAFTTEVIAHRWKTILHEEVEPRYMAWRKKPTRAFNYRLKQFGYGIMTLTRSELKRLYKIPAIRYLRDHYYDPMK